MIDGGAGAAEHDGILGVIVAQDIDDGVLAVIRSHGERPVFDIEVLLLLAGGGHANRLVLVTLRQVGDA